MLDDRGTFAINVIMVFIQPEVMHFGIPLGWVQICSDGVCDAGRIFGKAGDPEVHQICTRLIMLPLQITKNSTMNRTCMLTQCLLNNKH